MPKKKTHEEFVREVSEIFNNEYEVVGTYQNAVTPIEIMHKKCGNKFIRIPNNMITRRKCYCPICYPNSSTKCITGVNDIHTTNKKLFDLLDNKEDGYKYRKNSNKKVYFRCPVCDEKIYSSIYIVNERGLSCPRCGDGHSYPEKFMYDILNQLNIDFDYQWNPYWLKPYYYDFHFKMNDIDFVIEMDGKLGHGNSTFSNEKDIERIKIDNLKDELSKKYNVTVIRIDCAYKGYKERYDYIKNNIIKSLNSLFDMSLIDFEHCEKFASISFIKQVGDLWNSGIRGYKNIQKYYKLNRSTIRLYLKIASKFGIVNESYDEILEINRKYSNLQLAKTKGIAVRCVQTNEEFYSYAAAKRKYGVELYRYFDTKTNSKYCGTLPDGTHLTWVKI